jgi:hypothetical protein
MIDMERRNIAVSVFKETSSVICGRHRHSMDPTTYDVYYNYTYRVSFSDILDMLSAEEIRDILYFLSKSEYSGDHFEDTYLYNGERFDADKTNELLAILRFLTQSKEDTSYTFDISEKELPIVYSLEQRNNDSNFFTVNSNNIMLDIRHRGNLNSTEICEKIRKSIELNYAIGYTAMSFLIRNSKEDLASYIDNEDIPVLCDSLGNIYLCLQNSKHPKVKRINELQQKGITFKKAYLNRDWEIVDFYTNNGASKYDIERVLGREKSIKKAKYEEFEEYSQTELDDMYRDAFDGNEDAYWNTD